MSKIERKTQEIFAGDVPAEDNIAVFGSLAAGSPAFSNDPALIQNDAYKNGWAAAIVPDDSPPLEDMNALFNLITRQLAYLFQSGIPEYDTGATYYKGSVCTDSTQTPAQIYIALADAPAGTPLTDDTSWFALGSDKATLAQLQSAVNTLNSRIDLAELSSNSVDIVGTFLELQSYDTGALHPNDIVTVLADETNGGHEAYYRWDGTQFNLIAVSQATYTKDEIDGIIGNITGALAYKANTADVNTALAKKLSTVTTDATLEGDGTPGNPLGVAGGAGETTLIQRQNTYFIDPKYGDDSTAEFENAGKPYRTIEAALAEAIVPGPNSVNFLDWDFDNNEAIISGVTPFGTQFVLYDWRGNYGGTGAVYIARTNNQFFEKISMQGQPVYSGAFGGKTYWFAFTPTNIFSVSQSLAVPQSSGFTIDIETGFVEVVDWAASVRADNLAPPAGFASENWKIFANGTILYKAGDGTLAMHHLNGTVDNVGPTDYDGVRFSSNAYMVCIGGINGCYYHQSGVGIQDDNGLRANAFAETNDYLFIKGEGSDTHGIVKKSIFSTLGKGFHNVNVASFNVENTFSDDSSYVFPIVYGNTIYIGNANLAQLVIDSTSGDLVTAAHFEDTNFSSGADVTGIPVDGGIMFLNRTFFDIEGSDMSSDDVGVDEVVLDLSPSNDIYVIDTPPVAHGQPVLFLPARITISGKGADQTRVALGIFSHGVFVNGAGNGVGYSYYCYDEMQKAVHFSNAIVESVQARRVTLDNCDVGTFYIGGTDGSDGQVWSYRARNCRIDNLNSNSTNPADVLITACNINRFNTMGQPILIVGCDVFSIPPNSVAGNPGIVFRGCRLPINAQTNLPNATYDNCQFIY